MFGCKVSLRATYNKSYENLVLNKPTNEDTDMLET